MIRASRVDLGRSGPGGGYRSEVLKIALRDAPVAQGLVEGDHRTISGMVVGNQAHGTCLASHGEAGNLQRPGNATATCFGHHAHVPVVPRPGRPRSNGGYADRDLSLTGDQTSATDGNK